ncbi:nucleoside hydrolase [Ktedonosporobacter rubrisoli]|uniref:nucleoside hydrolase n=1 Tax=Ktedonosporobacter rubrisoli TaxID=2509675 RepID=UPI0013EE8442|nr:nucleoside hydrolase [Ktedonosporobacter rubrisoli]
MQRIILDTDPGIDDALAFFLALASPDDIKLEAVTTVSGNVGVEETTPNALALLTLAGRTDIPVARGCSLPLVREQVKADYYHGHNGLGDVARPATTMQVVAQHAAQLIIEKVMQAPGEITLVPIGPLTNIAMALRLEPRIAQNVREVVIMGGALRVPGNTTPTAEFNIYADPHAAQIVFQAGWPIRLVSLDVTEITCLRPQDFAELTASGGPVKSFIRAMIDFHLRKPRPANEVPLFQMHDPLCLATVFQPGLITWQPVYADVELNGTHTLGETVAYFKADEAPGAPNIQAPVAVDSARFIKLFMERVGKAF